MQDMIALVHTLQKIEMNLYPKIYELLNNECKKNDHINLL